MANVAAGAYLVTAKTTLVQTDNADNSGTIVCTLDAGGVTDTAEAEIGQGDGSAKRATVHMQLTHSFASTGSIVVRCNSAVNIQVVARHTTIAVIKVGAVTRTAVTG
jgi:hypothetical protein